MSLDGIARYGAQQMLRVALEAEVASYVETVKHLQARDGRQAVVRNGYNRAHPVAVDSGTIEAIVPRTRNRRGGRENSTSSIIPPYMRRSPKIDEVVPLLYLRGLSTGDMYPALEKLLGDTVTGLGAANVSRLKSVWRVLAEAGFE